MRSLMACGCHADKGKEGQVAVGHPLIQHLGGRVSSRSARGILPKKKKSSIWCPFPIAGLSCPEFLSLEQ